MKKYLEKIGMKIIVKLIGTKFFFKYMQKKDPDLFKDMTYEEYKKEVKDEFSEV